MAAVWPQSVANFLVTRASRLTAPPNPPPASGRGLDHGTVQCAAAWRQIPSPSSLRAKLIVLPAGTKARVSVDERATPLPAATLIAAPESLKMVWSTRSAGA